MNRNRLSALAAALFLIASVSPTASSPASAADSSPVGASGSKRVAFVASDKSTLPKLVFPTACLVMTRLDFGTASLTVTVNPDASVGNVVVDTSSGKPELDEAFRTALAKSRAVPGKLNGQPQPMPISVKMEATSGSRNIYGHAITVTVTRGSQPRVAQYTCYGNDPHPFDPRLLKN